MIRTQLYLDEEIHRRLRELADQQGRSLSALVRDALVRTYGSGGREKLRKTLQVVEGLWRNRKDLGPADEYVRRLRRGTRRKIRRR